MDSVFSAWSAWDTIANPQPSIKNSLHNDMVKPQDYLVCEMQNIMTASAQDIEQFISDNDLRTFNGFITNTVAVLVESCPSFNCLNLTSVAPSQRNANNLNCVTGGLPSKDCAGVATWNPMAPVECSAADASGSTYSGICDTDGKCYSSDMGFSDAIKLVRGRLASFNQGSINNLRGLDKFPMDDPTPLLMGAKLTLLQINLYQQLIMLGAADGSNGTLKAFANDAANWINARYTYLIDEARLTSLVSNYSTITLATQAGPHIFPVLDQRGLLSPLKDSTYPNALESICAFPDGNHDIYDQYVPAFLWDVTYGNYQVKWGCRANQALPSYQQRENFCYWANYGFGNPAIQPPCMSDTLPYGFTPTDIQCAKTTVPTSGGGDQGGVIISKGVINNVDGDQIACRLKGINGAPNTPSNVTNYNWDVCQQFNDNYGNAQLDTTFPTNWVNSHNQALQDMYAKDQASTVQQQRTALLSALANVKGLVASLRKLGSVGMPESTFGVLTEFYPYQQCDNSSSSPLSTGAANAFSLGGTGPRKSAGPLPLPRGAVPVAPAAIDTPATAAGRKLKLF